jgi:hypothetical protein
MVPLLSDCDLEVLRERYELLDTYAQAIHLGLPGIEELHHEVFALGGTEEDGWNSYHLVRNEFDRRAAEEFDLGQ